MDDINVKVTAETDAANLRFRNVAAEMQRMSQGFSAGSAEVKKLDDRLSGLLTRVDPAYKATKQLSDAVGLLDANLEAGNLSAAQHAGMMGKLEAAFKEATSGATGLGHGSAGVTRELIVLGHEAVSGNFSRMPGSVMVLASRMGGLSLATLGMGAAVGGTALVLYEWIAAAEHADAAARSFQVTLEGYSKGGQVSRDQFEQMVEQLRALPGVSHEAAEGIVAEFTRTRNISGPLMQELTEIVADFAAGTGQDATKAAKMLADALNEPAEGAKKLQKEFGFLTPQQIELIENFTRLGRTMDAQQVLVDSLADRYGGKLVQSLSAAQRGINALGNAFNIFKQIFTDPEKAGSDFARSIGFGAPLPSTNVPKGFLSDADAARNVKGSPDDIAAQNRLVEKGLDLEKSMGLLTARRADLEGKIAQLKEAQRAAESLGDSAAAAKFARDAAEAQKELAALKEKGSAAATAALNKARREAEQAAKEDRDLGKLAEEASRQHAAAEYEIKRQEIEGRRQLGLISAEDELQQLRQLKQEEYHVQLAALQAEYRLMEAKPVEQQKVNNRILALQGKFQIDMRRMQNQMALESKKTWDGILNPIGQSFSSAIRGMITGTTTLRQAVANVGAGIVGSFADAGLKMVGKWAESKLAMIGWTKLLGLTEDATAAETAAAQAAATAAQGYATVGTHAAEAGSAAYASTAAIPIIGPELAPAAAAAAYAGAMSFSSGIALPSAAGGWEVPKDTLAMVHENEMILPAPLSDKIRNMTEPGGGSGEVHLHVHAIDAASVHKLFMNNGAAIAAAMKQQARNFNPNTRPS